MEAESTSITNVDDRIRINDSLCFFIKLKDLRPDLKRDINDVMAKIITNINKHPRKTSTFDGAPLILTG